MANPAPPLSSIPPALASLSASPAVLSLLQDLHTQALTEPPYISTDSQPHTAALDRFVALDPDKCALIYLLLRSSGARFVVEAGTSFGVSTIWLALAVGQNAAGGEAKVIATENEPSKAERARRYWDQVPDQVGRWIDLRVGDLRETLKTDLPREIDFLLLDIWTPLALPTLQLVQPYLRKGAMVVIDNITAAAKGYKELETYFADPNNGFRTTVAPYGALPFFGFASTAITTDVQTNIYQNGMSHYE